jgi:hypothetical protein
MAVSLESSPTRVHAELERLAELLLMAEAQSAAAASAIAPPVRYDRTAGERYAAAREDWPLDPKPSNEQLAVLLGHTQQAAQSLGEAAAACRAAKARLDRLTQQDGGA